GVVLDAAPATVRVVDAAEVVDWRWTSGVAPAVGAVCSTRRCGADAEGSAPGAGPRPVFGGSTPASMLGASGSADEAVLDAGGVAAPPVSEIASRCTSGPAVPR